MLNRAESVAMYGDLFTGAMLTSMLISAGIGLLFYVWYLWSLSRLFPKLGLPGGWGWIPIWNQWKLVERGGLPGWLVLLALIPGANIVALVVLIIAMNRINVEHGKGAGFTVLGIFLPPVWAMLLANHIGLTAAPRAQYGAAGDPYGTNLGAAPAAQQGYGAAYGQQSGYGQPGGYPAQNGGYAAQEAYGHSGFEQQIFAGGQTGPAGHDDSYPGLPPVPAQMPQVPQAPTNGAPEQFWETPAPVASPLRSEQIRPVPEAPGAPAESAPNADAAAGAQGWGFSSTTEGAFERLAAEEVPPRPAALGRTEPDRPFSWPEDTDAPQPPAPPVPAVPAAPVPAPVVETSVNVPEPQSVRPAAEAASETDPEAPAESTFSAKPGALAAPEAPGPAAPAVSAAQDAGIDEDDDEFDRTVMVVRKTRWGIELPDGDVLELAEDDVVIGRKPEAVEGSAVLRIPDPTRTMSKSHVRMRREGESWSVEDLGSTNGLALISDSGEMQRLEPGQRIEATEKLVIGTLEVKLRRIDA